ncbi:hypothetical protein, variant [Exophiala sideris]|uniref:Major facilitator superfamily (MFS) profile domain-containing protein n=1 Tax=Exophiala sideris TaxID=1016849 RepID=A0A0D1YJX3_9EURO|nr:hypothetical protein PV11_03502 [Exophiala sideris]KIV81310.1 hypothetical protein, variant [Exophiala sideris]
MSTPHDKVLDVPDAETVEKVSDAGLATAHPELVDHPEPVKSKTWLAIIFLALSYACAQGINLIPVNVTNIIEADLGQPELATWIGSGYALALGVGILIANSLSDLLGRRWFIIGGGLLIVVGNIVGATAKSMPAVVAGVILMSVAQGGSTVTISAAGELVPKKYRGYVIGAMQTGLGVWIVAGSLIGHKLAVSTGPGWRSVFWMGAGINAGTTIGVALTYFPARALASFRTSGQSFLRTFDFVGLFGVIIVQVLICLGITYVQIYGAKSAHFLAPFLVGIVLIIPLVLHQTYIAKNPMLHPDLFRRVRTFTLVCVVGLVGAMLFYSIEDFFSTYLQILFDGDDQIQIGVDNIPFALGTNTGGVLAAVLLPVLGPLIGTHSMLTIGVAFQLVFIPLLCVPGLSGKSMVYAFSFLGGFGIGVMEVMTIMLVQYAAPDEYLGFSYGILGVMRGIGGSAGTSIYVTIFSSRATTLVPQYVAKAALLGGLPASSLPRLLEILTGALQAPLSSVPGATTEIIEASALALKQAYLRAFRYVWLTCIPFGFIALVCAVCTKDLSDQLTWKTPQHLKNVKQPEDIAREEAREMVLEERNV